MTTPIPSTAEAWLDHGQTLFREGQFEDAQRSLQHASRLCENGHFLLVIAHAQYGAGDTAGAIASFRRAALIDRNLVEAKERVGALLLEMGDAQAAILVLRSAVSKHKGIPGLHLRLGEAFEAVDKNTQALTEAQTAFALAPNSEEIRDLLARLGHPAVPVVSPPTANHEIQSSIPASDASDGIVEEPAPTSTSTSAMTSDLKEFRLPDLLQLLVSRRATGRMEVFSIDGSSGIIGLSGGRIVCSSHSEGRNLCTYLAANKIISAGALSTISIDGGDGAIAMRLVANGLIEDDKIRDILKERIGTSLRIMLSWEEGHTTFTSTSPDALGETYDIEIDTQWAIFEAVRQMDEEAR